MPWSNHLWIFDLNLERRILVACTACFSFFFIALWFRPLPSVLCFGLLPELFSFSQFSGSLNFFFFGLVVCCPAFSFFIIKGWWRLLSWCNQSDEWGTWSYWIVINWGVAENHKSSKTSYRSWECWFLWISFLGVLVTMNFHHESVGYYELPSQEFLLLRSPFMGVLVQLLIPRCNEGSVSGDVVGVIC